jgi:hypothetical protein
MTTTCLTALSFVSMIVHMRDRLIADAGAWTQSLGIMSGADAPQRRGSRFRHSVAVSDGQPLGWHVLAPEQSRRGRHIPSRCDSSLYTAGGVAASDPGHMCKPICRPASHPRRGPRPGPKRYPARPTGVVGPADRLLRSADEDKQSRPTEASAGVTSRTVDQDACPLRDGRRAKPIVFSVRNVPRRQPVSSAPDSQSACQAARALMGARSS